MGRLNEATVLNVKNRSHEVTAQVTVADGGASGVIIAQGGEFGGWSLYVADGRPTYCHNFLGLQRFKVRGQARLEPGPHEVRMAFAYDGGGMGKGGTVSFFVDGQPTGQGRIDATVPLIYSLDETTDIGRDTASPVSDDYTGEESSFRGTVEWVRIDVGEALEPVPPEDRLRIAMARQ
jgi:arylsulfatase